MDRNRMKIGRHQVRGGFQHWTHQVNRCADLVRAVVVICTLDFLFDVSYCICLVFVLFDLG